MTKKRPAKNSRPDRRREGHDGPWGNVLESGRTGLVAERWAAREALTQLYNVTLPQVVPMTRPCESCYGDGQGWDEDGNLTGSECEDCGGLGEFSDHNGTRETTQRLLAVDMAICLSRPVTVTGSTSWTWRAFCHCSMEAQEDCLIHGSAMDPEHWADAMLTALEAMQAPWASTILCLAERMGFTP